MKLTALKKVLEDFAPLNYQEGYDNSGLLVGNPDQEVSGAIVALDCTEAVVNEAIMNGCNLIVCHHPVIFRGLKQLTGKSYVERIVLKAIKNDVAIYAIHTNLDNVAAGVNKVIGDRIGLFNTKVLKPKVGLLRKLVTYCPKDHAEKLRNALFNAGAGRIGNYDQCSFNVLGEGTFRAGREAYPYVGERERLHFESEVRIEVVFLPQDERNIMIALFTAHPYEEVAFDTFSLDNEIQTVGSGLIGWLDQETDGMGFLELLKDKMDASVIRHNNVLRKPIRKVAVCGGSGSFLLPNAINEGADAFVTADFKYHDFFDVDDKLFVADIGHFESEQFTPDLLIDVLQERFPDLQIRLTEHNTNPVHYYF